MTLKSTRDMIEKIKENEMTSVDSVDYVRGLKGKDSVLIKPDDLPHPNTGSGINVGDIYRGKWYRIAIRTDGSFPFVSPSSGIFNVVNNYNNTPSKSVLFYAFVEGYDNGSYIVELGSSPKKSISKVRVLVTPQRNSYLDVFTNIPGEYNNFIISAACLTGFELQTPEEVSEAIPEGYFVKEVSF